MKYGTYDGRAAPNTDTRIEPSSAGVTNYHRPQNGGSASAWAASAWASTPPTSPLATSATSLSIAGAGSRISTSTPSLEQHTPRTFRYVFFRFLPPPSSPLSPHLSDSGNDSLASSPSASSFLAIADSREPNGDQEEVIWICYKEDEDAAVSSTTATMAPKDLVAAEARDVHLVVMGGRGARGAIGGDGWTQSSSFGHLAADLRWDQDYGSKDLAGTSNIFSQLSEDVASSNKFGAKFVMGTWYGVYTGKSQLSEDVNTGIPNEAIRSAMCSFGCADNL
uniref:Uncharacterized protein n=1 Tax=Oryza glumipatula TaxID=40148 RepID=A0A0D9Y8F4_9ORYZ